MALRLLKNHVLAWPIGIQVIVYVMTGTVIGMGVVIGRISNVHSYLSDAPETCMNCHVMTDAYATWRRGSHAQFTVCNDCHVPHSNPVAKVAFKSRDGIRHSTIFTLRKEPQVMELSQGARPVVQANCVRCHEGQLAKVRLPHQEERACWDCHDNIHGSVRSLSASPEVLRPGLPSAGLRLKKNK